MSAVALLALSLASGNVAYTLYLVGATWPGWTSLLRRAWGLKAPERPSDAVEPRDAGGAR